MQLTTACQCLRLICITIRKASDVTSKQPGSRQSFNTSCSPGLGANMLSTIAWLDLTVVTKAPTHALVTSDQDWSNRFKQQNKRTGDWCWSRKDNKKHAFNSEDLWDIRKAKEDEERIRQETWQYMGHQHANMLKKHYLVGGKVYSDMKPRCELQSNYDIEVSHASVHTSTCFHHQNPFLNTLCRIASQRRSLRPKSVFIKESVTEIFSER